MCMYVDPMHAGTLQDQKRVLDPLEMEMKMAVNHYMGHKLLNLQCRSHGRKAEWWVDK